AIDVLLDVEHAKGNPNPIALGRNANAILLEIIEPFAGGKRDDVDMRGAMPAIVRADQSNLEVIQLLNEMVTQIEAFGRNIYQPKLVNESNGGAEGLDGRQVVVTDLETRGT